MRLEAIIAEVRPRKAWEAVDLGWLLARSQYGRLVRSWVWMVWPVWGGILFLCRDHVFWGLAVIWWLKPQAERVPLWLLSRELFGVRVSRGELARQWWRVWFGDLWWQLFAGRFSPSRSVHMAMRQLEGREGSDGIKRAGRIAGRWGGAAWWSLMFHAALVHALSFSILLLALVMIPERYIPDPDALGEMIFGGEEFPRWLAWTWAGLYVVSLTLVGPLSVAAAFGLYVNARSRLEGWDVDLVFRRLANRLADGGGKAIPVVLMLLVGWGAWGSEAFAAEPADEGVAWSAAAEMEEILQEPEFKIHTRTIRKPSKVVEPRWSLPVWPMVAVAQAVVWALVALGISVVVVGLVKWLLSVEWARGGERKVRGPAVTTVLGMNVREESILKDVVRAARELLERGAYEEAVALLYRAALSWLIHRGGIPIRESDTEGDCVGHVRSHREATLAYFETLTRARVASAYGARRLPAGELDALLAEWPYVTGRREGA